MRCIVCGTEIPENCAFCPECGVKVESMEAAIPQPVDFSGQAAAATSAEQGEATQHVAGPGAPVPPVVNPGAPNGQPVLQPVLPVGSREIRMFEMPLWMVESAWVPVAA